MSHRVYMSFMERDYVWHCAFLEQDLRTPLKLKMHFRDSRKLYEIAARSSRPMTLEERQGIDHGIEIGRGGFYLELTDEQYAVIRKG